MGPRASRASLTAVFIIPNLVILLITLTLGLLVYQLAASLLEEDARQKNLAVLNQCARVTTQRIQEIKGILNQQFLNPYIQSFKLMPDPFSYPTAYTVVDTLRHLPDYRLGNDFVRQYYVFFNRSGLVMSPEGCWSYPDFFGLVYTRTDESYETWKAGLYDSRQVPLITPSHQVLYKGMPQSLLAFTLPLGTSGLHEGYITALVDSEQFEKLFEDVDTTQGGYAFVQDASRRVLYSKGTPPESPSGLLLPLDHPNDSFWTRKPWGPRVLVSYVASQDMGLSFVSVQEESAVLRRASDWRNLVFLIGIAIILLAVTVSYFLAERSSRPLWQVLRSQPGGLDGGPSIATGGMEGFGRALQRLISDNSAMASAMDRHRPLVRSAVMSRVLRGDYSSEDDAYQVLGETGLPFASMTSFVIVVRMEPRESPTPTNSALNYGKSKVLVHSFFEHEYPDESVSVDWTEDTIAAVVLRKAEVSTQFQEDSASKLQSLCDAVSSLGSLYATVAVGGPCRVLMDISTSLNRGIRALESRPAGSYGLVLSSDEVPEDVQYHFFPSDLEAKITAAVKAGNREDLQKSLTVIYHENFVQRHLTTSMATLLKHALWASVWKLIEQVRPDSSILESARALFELSMQRPKDRHLNECNDCLVLLCDMMAGRRRSPSTKLGADVCQFVNLRLVDPELSLKLLSERFSLSPVYLSVLFKEHSGINFVNYVENARIDRATELLLTTRQPVTEIAFAVGYRNVNSFCRLFKRLTGITATELRRRGSPDAISATT